MVRIFITGGAGQIGLALQEHLATNSILADSNAIVYIYDLVNNPAQDIMNANQLEKEMREFRPEIVIHLAAISNITDCNNDPSKAFDVNGKGCANVIKAAIKSQVQKIIYSSTASVYSKTLDRDDFNREDDAVSPDSIYGHSKYIGEKMLTYYCGTDSAAVDRFHGEVIILRLFNVVIEKKYISMANRSMDRLFNTLQNLTVNDKFTIYGNKYDTKDGTCVRDYISVKDVCRAFSAAMDPPSVGERVASGVKIYNVCSGIETSVLQIINIWYKKYTEKNFTVVFGEARKGDNARSIGDNSKISAALGWKPQDTIEKMIFSM